MQPDDRIREEAAMWAVRTGDPHFADWESFTLWLEGDPAHALAYSRVTAAVADAADAARSSVPANDDVAPAGVSRRWLGGAVAAMLAIVTIFGVWMNAGGARTIETAPGEMQMIALDDGGSIELAGGSRLVLDEDAPRFAELEYGRAVFSVVHDEADPFVVRAGDYRLVDVGTVFDVRLGDAGLSVGVAEGAVVYEPDTQAVRIDPGKQLLVRAGSDDITLRDMAIDQVGEWREGRLTFEQATIAEIAAELTGATGRHFSAAAGSEGRRLSGSLLVEPIRADPAALGPLLGVTVRAQGNGWVIEAN